MKFEAVSDGLVAWTRELIPTLRDGYSYPPGITDRLPDVAVVLGAVKDVPSDPEHFPFIAIEQVWLRVYEVELSIMVLVGDGEGMPTAEAEKQAQRDLEGFAETLMGSTQAGASLGDEAMISPRVETDLREPAEEREDGTRGRALYMRLVVAHPIEVPV